MPERFRSWRDDASAPPPDEPDDPQVATRPVAHESARLHVTGAAVYVDDIREPAGTLHLAPGRAPIACGLIRELDLAAVRSAAGVVAVITARDAPGENSVAPVFHDEPLIADDRIEYHGQCVYLVAATTRDAARRAAARGRLVVDEERPLVTIDDAVAAGARVLPDYAFGRGDVEAGLSRAAGRLSGSLRIGGQEHFYLEGQAALAIPGEGGEMLIHSSTQAPSEVQHVVARVLGAPEAFVTVETRRMGGGFGGKESQASQTAALAALAARVTGRPCKLRLDRDDDFAMTGKRHDFRAAWRAGFDAQGRLEAYDVALDARCGMSADLSLGVVDRAMFHAANCYFAPEVSVRSRRLKTNTVSNTAFRGFGGPQGMLAIERAMDAIAHETGRDPLDVRRVNLYAPGRDVTPYGMTVTEHEILAAIIRDLEASSSYRARRRAIASFNAQNPHLRRGIALTPVQFGISFTLAHLNQAGALVNVYADGSISLNHGGTEMGQGLHTKVAQVVAEEFGVGIDRVRLAATNTSKVPNASPTAASSGSDLNGMAARRAASEIKARMAEVAGRRLGVDPAAVVFRNGRVGAGNHTLDFGALADLCHKARVHLSAAGFFKAPKIDWDREKRSGRPFLYFSYGAACAEVAIDTLTGEMRVLRIDALHDVGNSLNPAIDRGQIEGALIQGVGWLTTEELVYGADGRLLTHAPSTYKIPVAGDTPADFRVALAFHSNRESTVYRSKAIGEPPLMLGISVFSAILDALHSLAPGSQVPLDAPATPEAILRAARALRPGAAP